MEPSAYYRRRLLIAIGVGTTAGMAGCLDPQNPADQPPRDDHVIDQTNENRSDDADDNEESMVDDDEAGDDNQESGGDDDEAAGDDDSNIPAPAFFTVSELDPVDITLEWFESYAVSATISNTGEEAGERVIQYCVDGGEIAEQAIHLSPGEQGVVEFTDLDTTALEEGEYAHGVMSPDDEQTGTLTVASSLTENQYYWDAGDYEPGETPSDHWEVANNIEEWQIAEHEDERSLVVAGDGDRSFLRYHAAGEVTDVEVWARARSDDTLNGDYGIYVRGMVDDDETGTHALRFDDHPRMNQFRLSSYLHGAHSGHAYTFGDRRGIEHGAYYETRGRVVDNQFMARWWPATEDEPETWDLVVDLDEHAAHVEGPGYLGLVHSRGGSFQVSEFAVGVDGDRARSPDE